MSMTGEENYEPPVAVIAERQRSLMRSMGDVLKRLRAQEDTTRDHGTEIINIKTDVQDVVSELKAIKKIGVGLLVSAVLGSVSITVAIILASHGHHL